MWHLCLDVFAAKISKKSSLELHVKSISKKVPFLILIARLKFFDFDCPQEFQNLFKFPQKWFCMLDKYISNSHEKKPAYFNKKLKRKSQFCERDEFFSFPDHKISFPFKKYERYYMESRILAENNVFCHVLQL